MFGAMTSPFMNGVSCVGIVSNGLRSNGRIVGTAANNARGINGLLTLINGGRRRIPFTITNSVIMTAGVDVGAGSAVYSPTEIVSCRGLAFPGPYCSLTIETGARTSRSGVNGTVTELLRRSLSVSCGRSSMAFRRVLSNLNRRRVRSALSGLEANFNISIGASIPGMSCGRAVHGGIGIRNGRGGRSNNRNRCNSI